MVILCKTFGIVSFFSVTYVTNVTNVTLGTKLQYYVKLLCLVQHK